MVFIPDPDGDAVIPLPAELDLEKEGFEIVEGGVRKLVEVLWRLGYRTVCSCAGHESELEPYPWVAIPMNLAAATKPLEKLAEAVARFNMSLGENGNLPEALKSWALIPVTSPSGFTIYLQPLFANARRSPEEISNLRASADHLALFLRNKCKDIFS